MSSPGTSVASSRQRTATARSLAGSTASFSTLGAPRSPVTGSERSFRSGTASPSLTGRSLDQYISSLDSAQYHAEKQKRHRSRERQDKTGRARSGSRKSKAREPSIEDRGRSAARYIKPAKRSPTSPVPMSPEDLRDLGAIGYGNEAIASPLRESRRVRDGSQSRVKSSKPSSRVRRLSPEAVPRAAVGSKPSSRNNSRRPSPDTRTQLTLIDTRRGRSQGREGSVMRSPSSPLPMSPQARFYQADDDDDDDLSRANEERKRFRSRHRSTSRLRERGSSAIRDVSSDRRRNGRSTSQLAVERDSSRTRKEPSPHPKRERQSHARSISDQKGGDLYQFKDERTLKKEQAARDLEERRKSLARRPSAPPIMHPEELDRLSPLQSRRPSSPPFLRASTFPSTNQPQAQPSRSQTTSPANIQTTPSGFQETSTSAVQVGLPATPRAMRHPKYDPDGKDIPDVPQIPEQYEVQQQPSWGSLNAVSYNNAFESLAPLPKTTYQAAPRRVPPRSASAPIFDEPPHSPPPLPAALPTHPAFQAALPPSSRRRTQDPNVARIPLLAPRKITTGDSQPGTLGYETRNNNPIYASGIPGIMSGIDETIEASTQPINPSNNDLTPPPPPPPPAPPILKELQHLAMPPPPPPPPLYRPHNPNTNSMVSGVSQGSGVSLGSGVIEIVMDDDEDKPDVPNPVSEPPPAPSQQQHSNRTISHNRGRSENDNTLTGRFSRAAERLRSASRGKSPALERTRSPQENSPYESLPPLWNPPRSMNNTPQVQTGNVERHPREVKAAMAMEGGMI
jgi:hypothetical protein